MEFERESEKCCGWNIHQSECFCLWWIVRSDVLVLRVWFTFQVHFEEIKLNGYDIRYFFVSFWMWIVFLIVKLSMFLFNRQVSLSKLKFIQLMFDFYFIQRIKCQLISYKFVLQVSSWVNKIWLIFFRESWVLNELSLSLNVNRP